MESHPARPLWRCPCAGEYHNRLVQRRAAIASVCGLLVLLSACAGDNREQAGPPPIDGYDELVAAMAIPPPSEAAAATLANLDVAVPGASSDPGPQLWVSSRAWYRAQRTASSAIAELVKSLLASDWSRDGEWTVFRTTAYTLRVRKVGEIDELVLLGSDGKTLVEGRYDSTDPMGLVELRQPLSTPSPGTRVHRWRVVGAYYETYTELAAEPTARKEGALWQEGAGVLQFVVALRSEGPAVRERLRLFGDVEPGSGSFTLDENWQLVFDYSEQGTQVIQRIIDPSPPSRVHSNP